MFKANCERNANRPALLSFDEKLHIWNSINFEEFYKKAMILGKALKLLDLNFKESVSILGFNHPKWNMIFWGCQMSNSIPVGHYQTNTAETCMDIINDSKSRIIFVDTLDQMKKIMSIDTKTPSLEYIVTFDRIPGVNYMTTEEVNTLATK
jgi:long-chain acyl-CoA synthetase